ncbi:accessory factor associated with RNA polymerase II [Lobosporangium transversale]|uniref:RNA pol II accessory factor, Cdc73 family-domain-containing protein n=1 Tax=Lobosporangium transversale TaxID=64571 RepID=A0A1Y2GXI7_9FUNG|nr:RNA pol II accessory factor, Cdc73 family-domain-containing protein [Lobosporangium transversale]KAF9918626.1 accessory factor associated with RNA polymerase II [Lobosporangium transversale]ORZ27000.1 RNA pol II accessory factor, Cdc73 family-domain-containing protein [Lobosporangium transversale]|eukprot:XP_021884747.1 RNA pol II accessory factor, Cdc73 family-domain-containing protein [Lobosporangium transversale]
MSRNDPLSLLREFTISKKPITLVNADGNLVTELTEATDVVFADDEQRFQFPRNTPTNYRRGASDETYNLETLLFLLQKAHLSVPEYSLEVAQKGIPIVSILDKRGVLDYLTGVTSTSNNILYQPTNASKRTGDGVADDKENDASKKQKLSAQSGHMDGNEVLRMTIMRERLARTTASVLRGNKNKSKDEKAPTKKPDPKQSGSATLPSSSSRTVSTAGVTASRSGTGSSSQNKSKSCKTWSLGTSSRIPIIIVPAAMTSMLTMYNVKQFLEDQLFVNSEDIRNQGVTKPSRLSIERRQKPNEPHKTPYHVIENADQLKDEDWDRVVCVFTTGAEWQFKKWKWQTPVQLFAQVKGFYVKWADEQPKEIIKSWNVEILNLNRHRRHADRAVVTEFWDRLQAWCLANKPHLAY